MYCYDVFFLNLTFKFYEILVINIYCRPQSNTFGWFKLPTQPIYKIGLKITLTQPVYPYQNV